MYAKLEEEYGLARRAMKIYDRATQVVADADKFEVILIPSTHVQQCGLTISSRQMFAIYIAKATENYGLPATRPIYERALEVLPNRQTAQMCLRFAQLERKLGEIDRARAIYAHASQFCDPRVNPKFWAEWNSFEIETGSEDTFREMLRIKRSVQAQFNTATSYLVAQAEATKQGNRADGAEDAKAAEAADPMAAAEREAGKPKGPLFVAPTQSATVTAGPVGNSEEIQIDEDDF